ncbi:MAG TPA: acid stress response protein YqgB [Enterobacteriaceae bacterium]|nr:acid stress response protein YqgB [Enterobacteriaceae bacterium]
MKKKPVAQSAFQYYVLETPAVYGLLSQRYAAIVVNCPTLELTI